MAIKRAAESTAILDDWRRGRGTVKDIDLQPGFGTLEWLVERYKGSNAWKGKVSARSRYEMTVHSSWYGGIHLDVVGAELRQRRRKRSQRAASISCMASYRSARASPYDCGRLIFGVIRMACARDVVRRAR